MARAMRACGERNPNAIRVSRRILAPDTPCVRGLMRLLAGGNYSPAKLRVMDGSTGMPGPVVVDTVIFFR